MNYKRLHMILQSSHVLQSQSVCLRAHFEAQFRAQGLSPVVEWSHWDRFLAFWASHWNDGEVSPEGERQHSGLSRNDRILAG